MSCIMISEQRIVCKLYFMFQPWPFNDKFARENPGDRNATESARAVREAPAIIEKIIKDLESGKIYILFVILN